MGRCATCRHWRLNLAHDDHDPLCQPEDDYGDLIMPLFEVRECLHPDLARGHRPPTRDGCGMSEGGRLVTGPEYGCVQYTKKGLYGEGK